MATPILIRSHKSAQRRNALRIILGMPFDTKISLTNEKIENFLCARSTTFTRDSCKQSSAFPKTVRAQATSKLRKVTVIRELLP